MARDVDTAAQSTTATSWTPASERTLTARYLYGVGMASTLLVMAVLYVAVWPTYPNTQIVHVSMIRDLFYHPLRSLIQLRNETSSGQNVHNCEFCIVT